MPVYTASIELSTRGNSEIIDITDRLHEELSRFPVKNGILTVFVPGSTGGILTLEYEPGLIGDLQEAFERLIPRGIKYRHDRAWGDGNGHSHVRASLVGPSLTVPFVEGKMTLGTWQQVAFVDFDNRPRRRSLVVQVVGE
jgi:secondary thiamine-phosphate synthase enzyme